MSRTNAGLNAIYNGGLQSGYMAGSGRMRRYNNDMHGAGFMDFIKKGINFAKENKLASKLGAVADAVGATQYLNDKTGGKFSQAVDFAKDKGFGRKRRTRTTKGGKRRVGRPRKMAGSKTQSGGRRRKY